MSEGQFRQARIEGILTSLIEHGDFTSAVIASSDGLPLATVGKTNTDMIAAVAASMKNLAERAHEGLTEITTRDDLGQRIVSRYFAINDDLLLLAIQVPARRPYRRLTNNAIRAIQNIWLE